MSFAIVIDWTVDGTDIVVKSDSEFVAKRRLEDTLVNIDLDTIAGTDEFEFRISWLTSHLIVLQFPTLRTFTTIFL